MPQNPKQKKPHHPPNKRNRKARARCPICNAKVVSEDVNNDKLYPFCSTRCKNVDLKHWFDGDYCISRDITPEDLEQNEEE